MLCVVLGFEVDDLTRPCDISVLPLSALGCPLSVPPPRLSLTALPLSGSSGAGVPTEAAARPGRSSEENHPAA